MSANENKPALRWLFEQALAHNANLSTSIGQLLKRFPLPPTMDALSSNVAVQDATLMQQALEWWDVELIKELRLHGAMPQPGTLEHASLAFVACHKYSSVLATECFCSIRQQTRLTAAAQLQAVLDAIGPPHPPSRFGHAGFDDARGPSMEIRCHHQQHPCMDAPTTQTRIA